MNRRSIWVWIAIAAALGVFVFVIQPRLRRGDTGPVRVIEGLKPQAVTTVRVHPRGQPEIRAQRTNDSWQLLEPLSCPAEAKRIDGFLSLLQKLVPATLITAEELKTHSKADEEFGFNPPESSVQIEQDDSRIQFLVGSKTGPGDQVFFRVIGHEGLYVVDSAVLEALPRNVNHWRQTRFINLKDVAFDNLSVTNGANMSVLQRDSPASVWRMTFPISARADNARIEEALEKLQALQIRQFLPEDAKPDSDLFGLQPADLELVLRQGTNITAWMQFGKSPTNAAQLVYARLLGQNTIISVPKAPLAAWYGAAYNFRDPRLINLSQLVTLIEVHGADNFLLEQQTNGLWQVLPQKFPADTVLVKELLSTLGGMQVAQFVKGVVVEPDLPSYGLAPPVRQYTLKATTNYPGGLTNLVIADLRFGTNAADKVFVKRADEDSVYAINLPDFQALPAFSWQLREREIWNFTEEDVARVTISQRGKIRQLINKGNHQWTLAPGSQGSIETFAVDQTVRGLGRLAILAWAGRGAAERARLGFPDDAHQITLELKNGESRQIEFGDGASSDLQYAGTKLEGDFWIFVLDPKLYRDVSLYLSIP